MGIVVKQSYQNVITLLFAILVGALNTLFLYVYILDAAYYGLVTFLLSTAFILKPLIALGVNHSIIKFFSVYQNKEQKDAFLSMMLWWPLLFVIFFGVFGFMSYDTISQWLSQKNNLVKNYIYYIFLVAFANAYFEIFYAWAKVHLKSVFGNILKELFVRICVSFLLLAVYFEWLNNHQFVLCLVGVYFLQTLIMKVYAYSLYMPRFTLMLPANYKEILKYSVYVLLAASAATILLDIDKFMIPQKKAIEQVAFYAVAVYIGSVIEIPGRAMAQIIQPLTAKALNLNQKEVVLNLYQKSSIHLLIVSGGIFMLVNANIMSLFQLMPQKYAEGVWVVLMISLAKLYHMFLGTCGSIISNSKYYKVLLPYGIAMAVSAVVLNTVFIETIGINGAALATLIVVLVFNSIKLWYVKSKFNMLPISYKTWRSLGLVFVLTIVGMCVHVFSNPILNIIFKSIILLAVYIFCVLKMKLSDDITIFYDKVFKSITSKFLAAK